MSVAKLKYEGYPHYSFVQSFETGITPESCKRWFENYWHYSLYVSVAYLILIYSLREYMKNKSPIKVRRAVLIWDASIAVFSICGMLRTVPEIVYILKNYGLEHSVCDSTINSVTIFWGMAFVLSKGPELLDTVFLVLKKQKLTYLHVSHHVLTFVICFWYASDIPAIGRWVIAMNYSVHSFMYSYFALKAARINIPINISMIMTSVQILQMVVGLFAGVYALRANLIGHQCTTKIPVALAGLTFALFLLCMFINFFLHRYKFIKTDSRQRNKSNVD